MICTISDIDLDFTRHTRERLWRNGFRPVPVLNPGTDAKGAGKRPAGSGQHWGGWEIDARQNPPYAVTTKPLGVALNTGILADGLRPVDIDVDDDDLANAIDRLAVDMLGDAPMRFREDSPRRMRLYRAAEGEPRHAEVLEGEGAASAAKRKPWGVEVLGHGNQFVALGCHPSGAFLDWHDGRSPLTAPRDQLLAVTEAQVAEFLSLAGELIGADPSCQNRQNRQNPSADDQGDESGHPFVGSGGSVVPDGEVTLADVQAALAVIAGDGGSYKLWVRVGMAIFATTGGSLDGLAAYDDWSQKSPKYDPAAVQKMWRTFRPRSIGFGSLVHLAREADPTWRAPSWRTGDTAVESGGDAPPTRIATDILNRNFAPPPVMPLAVFGTGWGDWLPQAALAANAPSDYVATSLLAVAGSLIGNARWGRAWDGWAEPSVLWCALVGEPSASKTPAANAVLKLLRQVEADMAEGFDEQYAAWEEAATRAKTERKQWEASVATGDDTPMPRGTLPPEPMRPLASTGSVTVEKVAAMMQAQPKGFLIANDELAGWLNNMQRYSSGTDRPFWLTAWTGSPYRVDRKTSATAIIPCLLLGIFGTIQPDRLATAFKGADDGLPARFLFCWPEARPFARPRGTVNVARATEALCKLARLETSTAEDGSPVPVFVTATEEAAEALTDFAREMQAQERQAGGLMIGVLGKARGYALRLAVVLEYLPWVWHGDRREPTVISGIAMSRAIELMRSYFLPMASRVLGDAAVTQQERDARTLAKWIAAERPQKLNLRELSRGQTGGTALHGLRDRKQLQAAADWLQDCGWFQRTALPSTDGRPRAEILIADGLWAALNEQACQNRQNCQKSAAVEIERDSVGSVGSVGNQTVAGEADKVVDQTPDGSILGRAPALLTAPIAHERAPTPPGAGQLGIPRDGKVLSLLERLLAKKKLAESQR